MLKYLLFTSLSVIFSFEAITQVFEIENGTVSTCGGVFYDDNGGVGAEPGTIGNDYSGTSYTYTICPDNPGDGIAVEFVGFSVTQNPNPQNNDVLRIFNGDSSGAPLMGSSNAINFSGITFAANTDNPTGCLTFVFNQNPNNLTTGGWQANIECITPCSTPYAEGIISSHELSAENGIQACVGEPITFEDVASAAGVGFTLGNYIWDFGDGTSSVGPAIVDHIFEEPGEYIAALIVEDNNGCTSTNITPFQILVSTLPVFNTDYTAELCLGSEGNINGNPVQSETWTALPPQVVSGETYLADGVGFQFESILNFNFFDEGQTLDSCEDLYGININMEHSYIGDLDIVIECPDGTEVILLDYPNGGGGGYLGEPVDIGGDLTPGVGYSYSWTSDAVNGSFGDEAIGGTPLPEGNYSPEGDLCDLVGCPLNGQWTLTIVDNLAADDGTVFEWGIDLNPELFPGVTTFTPVIGLGLDSTWIEGPNILSESVDGNFIEIGAPALGVYDYQIFAANNFGCTFDTTVTVEVFPQPEINMPETITGDVCTDFTIDPEIIMELYSTDVEYELILENTQGLGFGGGAVEIFINGVSLGSFDSTTELSSFNFSANNGDVITLEYTESTWGNDGNQMSLLDGLGNSVYQSAINPISGVLYESATYNGLVFEWNPTEGLDNPESLSISGEFLNTTTYELSVYPSGFPVCTVTEEIQVITEDSPNPGISTEVELCSSDFDALVLLDLLEGSPDQGGTWFNENNVVVDPVLTDLEADGVYTYLLSIGACDYESELDLIIHSLDVLPINDTTICQNGIATLNAELSNNQFADVSYVWNNGLFTNQSIDVQPILNQTTYTVFAEYSNGCVTEVVSVNVATLEPLEVVGLVDETICLGDSVVVQPNMPEGGLEPYSFTWSSPIFVSTEDTVSLKPTVTTAYTLQLTDACESTPYEEEFVINLNPIIPATFNGSGTEGCFPITSQFTGEADDLSLVSNVVWEFGDGSASNSVNAAIHSYTNPGAYDVTLTITGIDGCVYTHTEEDFVDAYDVPTAEFAPIEYEVIIPNNTFEFENFSIGADQSQWTFDEYGTSTETNPEFSFPLDQPTDLQIELVSLNSEGCSDTARYTVFLEDGFALYAPNAFTPDNDGINDVWKIEGVDIDASDFEIYVYNRMGEVVYFSANPKSAWDGSFESGNHYVPNGVYTYLIKTRAFTTRDKKEITGLITIFR